MQNMYPGKVNSPQTELASAITDTDTTIPLLDASVLPDPPNICTIGTGENAETVLYEGKNGNDLINVTRGFQGTAQAWSAGQKVARLFTLYDYEAVRKNLTQKFTDEPPFDLIQYWQEPAISPELFTLSTGINEFSLLYVDGFYHLFYDDKTQTKHRQAETIEGLASATDDLTIAGRYPSAFYEDGTWHLFVWNRIDWVTEHYTASSASGPYTYSGDVLTGKADFYVTKNPTDGLYYGVYKDISPPFSGVVRSDSIYGPWDDLGPIYDTDNRTQWHEGEEADPHLVFRGGRAYVLFAGWDGSKQRIGMVELDTNTYKAKGKSYVLATAEESWQIVNGRASIFSPVYLRGENITDDRIFYAQNPGAAMTAGWGYLKPSLPIITKKKASHLFFADFDRKRDLVTNIPFYMVGTPVFGPDGVELDGSSGLHGSLSKASVPGDFTVIIEVTFTDLSSAQRLLSLNEEESAGNVINLYVENSKFGFEINSMRETSLTTPFTNTRYRVCLRKYGSEVRLVINGVTDTITTTAQVPTKLKFFNLGFRYRTSPAPHQFFVNGTIHRAEVIEEALPLSML